ncbi:MAG: cytochrome c oxidase accessory protein CcoG [Gammaproteobacteria bacterium]
MSQIEISAENIAQDQQLEQELYARREKIYPREVHGLFAGLRVTAVVALLGLFYGLPWLQWDGHPAILLDLPARKFHIFSLALWPQDFVYLAFLLIIAALSLFFFTALAGRIWCGYACPQTVWTEVFLWMERMVEGGRIQQMRLDESPWNARKFRIKAGKHLLWLVFSLFTGFSFVAYFTPAGVLLNEIRGMTLGPWETFWILFYGFATYGNAGWMREQVCMYMCPYARFQSAMFDDDTLIVSYDQQRGEPRGPRRPDTDHRRQGLGDCINCGLCVRVCPTGIDIRDGLQYQCISCSACIDACNDVMARINYPKGLIRYTTQNSLRGKDSKFIRPRIIIYAVILLTIITIFIYSMTQRLPLGLDVIRDRNQLYRETNSLIENVYTLKIINMDKQAHEYQLQVSGIDTLQFATEPGPISVMAGQVLDLPVRVMADESSYSTRSNSIRFTLTATDDDRLSVTEQGRFLGPLP